MRSLQHHPGQLILGPDEQTLPEGQAFTVPAARARRRDVVPAPARAGDAQSQSDQGPNFAAFVAAHQPLIHAYVARVLGAETAVDREAVIQEALLRVWSEWSQWPRSPERRLAYLKRALRCCALDALRARRGPAGRRQGLPADLGVLHGQRRDRVAGGVLHAVPMGSGDPAETVGDRLALAAALAALTELERRAVCLSAQGYPDREIAALLQVGGQRVRTVLMDARALLHSLLDHADHAGPPTEPQDACAPFADPATPRGRRLVRRHLHHCPSCHPSNAGSARR
jgi:RNA polymerase sigma factor (sigma-70 family)